jgi:thioredoxin reductase (NADPH)
LKNIKTNEVKEYNTNAVFLAIGHIPNTKIFEGILNLDEKGYIKATPHMHTNLLGVFAAGDVQDIHYRQAITAAGSGCMAAMEAERYLAGKE